MFRRLALATLAVVLPLAMTAIAVPPGVNLHNGYILITDNTRYEGPVPHSVSQVVLHRHGWGTPVIAAGYLRPHGSFIENHCCVLAGSGYYVIANQGMNAMSYFSHTVDFVPRLCNIRGIPFGYAHIVVSGTVAWDNAKDRWVASGMHATRADTGCPE